MTIEFDLNEPNNWLLGIHKMEGFVENINTGEIKELNTLMVGFLFFSVIIYFKK